MTNETNTVLNAPNAIAEKRSPAERQEFTGLNDASSISVAVLRRFGFSTVTGVGILVCLLALNPPRWLVQLGVIAPPPEGRFYLGVALIGLGCFSILLLIQFAIDGVKYLLGKKSGGTAQSLPNQQGAKSPTKQKGKEVSKRTLDIFDALDLLVSDAITRMWQAPLMIMICGGVVSLIVSALASFDIVNNCRAVPTVIQYGVSFEQARTILAEKEDANVVAAWADDTYNRGHYELSMQLYSIAINKYEMTKTPSVKAIQVARHYAERLKAYNRTEEAKKMFALAETWEKALTGGGASKQ